MVELLALALPPIVAPGEDGSFAVAANLEVVILADSGPTEFPSIVVRPAGVERWLR